jgi:putative Mn2+ efflux pump MntP
VTVVKVALFVLSLGVDTLVVAASLGAAGRGARLRLALAFAAAEAAMPLVGLVAGRVAGAAVGRVAPALGGLGLLALAIWLWRYDRDDVALARPEAVAGWGVLVAALSISLDELAAGFSIGLVGVPVVLTLALVAAQSFAFTLVGLTYGARLRPYLGERAERAAAGALALVGAWVLVEAAARLLHP